MRFLGKIILLALMAVLLAACGSINKGSGSVTSVKGSTPVPDISELVGDSEATPVTTATPTLQPAATEVIQESAISDVAKITVSDRGNLGNSADIEIQLEILGNGERLQDHRIILVKADLAATFTVEEAADLSDDYKWPLPKLSGRVRLPASLADADGEAVVEGISYVVFVFGELDGSAALSKPSKPFTLVNEIVVWTLVDELPSATGGLAIDHAGNLFAANIGPAPSRRGTEIFRITPGGEVDLWVEGQGILGASGNTFDREGNLLQSSLRANAIHRISPEGVVTQLTTEGIRSPVGITITADETIYVASCGSDTVQRITAEGESERFAEDSLFSCPNGITHDEAGNFYVANFSNGDVIKITPTGEASLLAEIPGHNNGHIIYHEGLFYVAGRGRHQIFTLTLDGEIGTLAGTGERGHKDGPAADAAFSLPNDIAVAQDGQRLYVNEVLPITGSANHPSVIRVIELIRGN